MKDTTNYSKECTIKITKKGISQKTSDTHRSIRLSKTEIRLFDTNNFHEETDAEIVSSKFKILIRNLFKDFSIPGYNHNYRMYVEWGPLTRYLRMLFSKLENSPEKIRGLICVEASIQFLQSVSEVFHKHLLSDTPEELDECLDKARELIINYMPHSSLTQNQRDLAFAILTKLMNHQAYVNKELFDIEEVILEVAVKTYPVDEIIHKLDHIIATTQSTNIRRDTNITKARVWIKVHNFKKAEETLMAYSHETQIKRIIKAIQNLQKTE